MRVYLDTCCLNRLFDKSLEPRVRHEAEAVEAILASIERLGWTLLSSGALEDEVGRTPDPVVRNRAQAVLEFASERIPSSDAVAFRAADLTLQGLKPMDALHIASAEAGHADAFLTTDDRLIRAARRRNSMVAVPVWNPVAWLERNSI